MARYQNVHLPNPQVLLLYYGVVARSLFADDSHLGICGVVALIIDWVKCKIKVYAKFVVTFCQF
jgi:hypothetical protein